MILTALPPPAYSARRQSRPGSRTMRFAMSGLPAIVLMGFAMTSLAQEALVAFRVERGGIVAPLTREAGDFQRGFGIVTGSTGNCTLCHSIPDHDPRSLGELAPALAGVGSRLGAAQLRLRVVDSSRVVRDTIMPSYYRVTGLRQVSAAYRDRPILTAQQVEDVVAYLSELR